MTTKPSVKNARIEFSRWKKDDRALEQCLDAIRDWMLEASNDPILRFADAATRLSQLRSDLVAYFDREDELIEQLCEFYRKPCPEIEAMQRQASSDHQRLLGQLDELVCNLKAFVPPYESWQAVIANVEWFIDSLEQHAEQESQSIAMMMPSKDS